MIRSVLPHSLVLVALLVWPAPQASSQTQREWHVLEGCELIDHPSNDGDSFRVRWEDREFVFRIYFADAPEQDRKWRDRVEAQAEYFGITVEQAVEVGILAKEFTLARLRQGFTIKTRWQDVFSTARIKRKYGFVILSDGQDLAEALVENGLARIHGVGVRGLTREEVARLKALENEARLARRGAWALRGCHMRE